MLLQATNTVGRSPPSAAATKAKSSSSLLLTENQQSIGGPPSLMEKLTLRERETVLKQGRRRSSTADRRCSVRARNTTAFF